MGVYEEISSAQFENENSLRMYPFSEGCSLADNEGKELSRDAIVDLHIVVPYGLGNNPGVVDDGGNRLPVASLSSIHVSNSMVSACFRCGNYALSVTVARENFIPYFPYRLEKLAGTENAGGVVTFGDIDFPGFPETYLFRDRFEGDVGVVVHPCCIAVAEPPALKRFVDPRSGESVTGDVNIDFSGYVISERRGKSFLLSLEEGADAELASECAKSSGVDVCGATPIFSINGVKPDENGNIVLWFH
jgi:hypothetical protein